ncbi:hypothetical protein GTP58_18565 [Duganella sp. CY15W]|uniref:hypothetical protein n=1 Tax=Duganella sp. CY15W TaxID=2692172 RepID=UPI00136A3002|nr:hypothetical protein [Duganella sp. CY15W]MYM30338.1 hypothetical protein [Duganella sp. CY15W]
MNANLIPERNAGEPDRRHDGPVETIDAAVVLASVDGVGPALDYMSTNGIPHATALRVLAGPRYHRQPDMRTIGTVLDQITAKKRGRAS